jgi:diphthine synthase
MLYLVGLGLRGIRSLTLEGESVIRRCQEVYFEYYTSIPPKSTLESLASYFGREIKPLERAEIEIESLFFQRARDMDICVIVTGDPLSATTHNQIRYDLSKAGIQVEVIENSSILTEAPSRSGLFHYRFGPPVSIPFCTDKFLPSSVLEKIKRNLASSLHTLLLLDLNGQEPMAPSEAADTLLKMEERYEAGVIGKDTEVVLLSSLHMPEEKIVRCRLGDLFQIRSKVGPSVIIIPSTLNDQEKSFLAAFAKEFSEVFSEDSSQQPPSRRKEKH